MNNSRHHSTDTAQLFIQIENLAETLPFYVIQKEINRKNVPVHRTVWAHTTYQKSFFDKLCASVIGRNFELIWNVIESSLTKPKNGGVVNYAVFVGASFEFAVVVATAKIELFSN